MAAAISSPDFGRGLLRGSGNLQAPVLGKEVERIQVTSPSRTNCYSSLGLQDPNSRGRPFSEKACPSRPFTVSATIIENELQDILAASRAQMMPLKATQRTCQTARVEMMTRSHKVSNGSRRKCFTEVVAIIDRHLPRPRVAGLAKCVHDAMEAHITCFSVGGHSA
jgi:hypothetical protein